MGDQITHSLHRAPLDTVRGCLTVLSRKPAAQFSYLQYRKTDRPLEIRIRRIDFNGVGVVEPPPRDSPPDCPILIGSSPPRYQESRYPVRVSAFLVPVTGLEPVRCRQRWILSFARYLELGVL